MWLIVMHPMVLSACGPHAVLTDVSYTKPLLGRGSKRKHCSHHLQKTCQVFAFQVTQVVDYELSSDSERVSF